MTRRTQRKRDKRKSHTSTAVKRSAKEPIVPTVEPNVRPGNNFYMYVNRKWLKHAHMPEDQSSYGVSEEIEDEIRGQLLGLIHRHMDLPSTETHESTVATFFRAGHYSNRHQDHMKTFKTLFQSFQCMRGPEDVAHTLGKLIAAGVPTLLTVGLGRDLKNPNKNVLTLYQGYLSLPDSSYYLGEAPGKLQTLRGFETLIRRLGDEMDVEGMERIISMEAAAAEPLEYSYGDEPKMMKGRHLERHYKDFPWSSFFAGLGLTDWEDLSFLNGGPSWLEWLGKQMSIPIADWITWFRVQTLLYFAPVLPAPFDMIFFRYFGRRLRGDREKMTQDHLLFYIAQNLLSTSLGIMYRKCCLSEEHRRSTRLFAERIRRSAIQRVGEVDWLSPAARKKTQEKIRHLDMKIAETDGGVHYTLPQLSEQDVVSNMMLLSNALMERNIYYAKHPLIPLYIMDPVYEVNAHYYNSGNRLVIPGGITRWPFYKAAKGLGWCYGGLGAVVGHEMLHAFDEDGKNYDQDGVYGPWWSHKDMAAYNKKTKALIRLFNRTTYMGRTLSGKSTLSENIADLGGLAIALDALKREMKERQFSEADEAEALREFFVSYAVSWRTKERRQKSLYRLFTDSHAPAEIRVNRIVSHFSDWYSLFNVQPSDELFIDVKDRISIF